MENAIEVENLTKSFSNKVAVDSVSFNVKKGEIFGLLGPNGAGKTTTLRMITTLLKPDSGKVKIFNYDNQKQAAQSRGTFAMTGQYATVDQNLTANENLLIFGKLNGLSGKKAKQRSAELLKEFELSDAADKVLSEFSGGMRRRLDLAVSLISKPQLLFLDEPTTGLDPRTRVQMWETIRKLVKEGSTVVLTTQYLDEADQLADRIAVIDHGKLVSLGTPVELKKQVGGSELRIHIQDESQFDDAKNIVASVLKADVANSGLTLTVQLNKIDQVADVLNELKKQKIMVAELTVQEPTLDDVFFALTGDKN